MEKIQINMVFRNLKDTIDFRILYISYDYSDIVCIDLNNVKSLPYYDNTANIEAQISNGELHFLENDPYFKIYDESVINQKYLKMRDTAYNYIKTLCNDDNLLDLCSEYTRGILIKEINTKLGVSKTTIYKNMRKYLQGGMTKNSLLPPLSKPRVINYSNKPGKKRSITPGEGIIVDALVLLHIKDIYENYYLPVDGSTIKQAYHEFLDKYYFYLTIENNKEVRKILDDDKILTDRQFRYHMNNIRNFKRETIDKIGVNKFQQNQRPTLSKEDIDIFGPGHLYEIDSTISDIYLVSNLSRNIGVGRATLYITTDVYSRLITGFYTGFEESGWIAAMMAYMNMNDDKVEFCKKYGIDIEENQWPSYGIPSRINADRGETIGKASDQLVKHLHISIINNPPYCPDMKGIVERWFYTINEHLRNYAPGGVRKDHQQRGGLDYRKKAVLNIREFNQFIIEFILAYNNTVLNTFSMSRDMLDNLIVPTPVNIWNYGATMKLLFTSSIPKEKMMLALMPKDKASVERGGILFEGLYYSCKTGITENWFLKVSNGPKKIDIAYDPRNLNKIYIYDKKTMKFEMCNMLPKSFKDYNDISLDELKKIRSTEAKLKKLNNSENITLQINSHHKRMAIIDNAIKQSKIVAPLSKDKIKNIPINKRLERTIMRKEEYFDLDPQTQSKDADVVILDKSKKPLDNGELSYEDHEQKHKDEMNALLQSIVFANKDNK